MESEKKKYATFTLNELLFGIEVHHVQEVLIQQDMTPVPLASATVRGLINLRGQIVTAIDLRRRFGLEPSTLEAKSINLVIRDNDGPVSLLADEIGDVIEADPSMYERTPANLNGKYKDMVLGVYKLPAKLLLILDTDRVLALGNDENPTSAGGHGMQ